MPFSPVVELNVIKEQPIVSLMSGNYDKTKVSIIFENGKQLVSQDILWGQVEHETEIYVRTLFGEPVGRVVYDLIWKVLVQGEIEIDGEKKKKSDLVLEEYPSACKAKFPDFFVKLLENKVSSMKPGDLVYDDISKYESPCDILCETDCTDAGPLCGILAGTPGCKALSGQVCEALKICDPNEEGFDERRTAEPPGTQWIFTCPVRKALTAMAAHGKPVYMYEFRDFMPIDLTKVGDDGDGWENYDSCGEFACHGAELSYVFV